MPQTALENEDDIVEGVEEEFEIVIEDDTPEEDRDREPMPEEIVDNLEKDELEEYSVEKSKQLKKYGTTSAELKKKLNANAMPQLTMLDNK